jgi:hypothetical protein
VFRFARYPILAVAVAALTTTTTTAATPLLHAADGVASVRPAAPSPYILVGFAGGFVRHDNTHHGPVQLAQKIQQSLAQSDSSGVSIQVFENRHRKSAYKAILAQLDSNHDGVLSAQEKAQARIILFGHSWGASAVVMLARELDRAGIPVLLTVQVDSVAKPWESDKVIPENVAAAANFYQPHGLIHGRSQITAADGSKTQILGNYRFDYQKSPVPCQGAGTWFDRLLTPSHMQSQCDPQLWNQVETLVRQHMEPATATVATLP